MKRKRDKFDRQAERIVGRLMASDVDEMDAEKIIAAALRRVDKAAHQRGRLELLDGLVAQGYSLKDIAALRKRECK